MTPDSQRTPGPGSEPDPEASPRKGWDGGRVLQLRTHLAETQDAMARRLGTRQQTVSEWETGASRPRGMSQRLLHIVAEQSGFYDAFSDAGPPAAPADARSAEAGDESEQHKPPEQHKPEAHNDPAAQGGAGRRRARC